MSEDRQRRPGPFSRLVGSVVSPVVDSVDVDHIVERIDVNDVVGRVDLDAVIANLDVDAMLDQVDPERLLDRIDPDRLLDRIDPDRLLDRIDPDRLLDRLDLNRLLDRLDVDRLIGRIDLNALVQRVDLDAAIDGVDIDRVIGRVDLDAAVDRVDIDRAVDRVDLNRAVDRVDLNRAVDRVDLNRAMDRVDLNAVVERTELGAIIARSTTGVFGQLLDVARTQIMSVDQVVQALPARLLRNARREIPGVPTGAPSPVEVPPGRILTSGERAAAFQGRYAGSLSRFLAFVVDQFTIGALFALGAFLVSAAMAVVIGADPTLSEDRRLIVAVLVVVAYVAWAFIYYAGSTAATGRTVGKAILGLLVVDSTGQRVGGKAAALRTLVFPISFLLFGIGLILGLLRPDRRELHDLIAKTAVIYQWDVAVAEGRISAT
jgi:uncharacterized RDD family membrane protein YckC